MFFHDDIICRSCGKQYKYRAWANKHFWSCKTPNESHIAERHRIRYWEKKYLEMWKPLRFRPIEIPKDEKKFSVIRFLRFGDIDKRLKINAIA